ncbi:hypothetical protein GS4_05_03250 [Gordonia soli NBRC 108243]|uniref:Uncharacterized protein n=1 Tax=Gordonia soli NBRC 108243 TaxID=1223545 RepID=M0QI59_9ACTN|nr:hypothetical protein GS4_05_03250 [Gordonia soli NBRC 108243]
MRRFTAWSVVNSIRVTSDAEIYEQNLIGPTSSQSQIHVPTAHSAYDEILLTLPYSPPLPETIVADSW